MIKIPFLDCPLFVILATYPVACHSKCNICKDGSDITRPNLVLNLTQPVSLKTCRDLSETLSPLSEEADLCINAKAFATLCGCPKDLDACTICDNSMIRPKKVLDKGLLTSIGNDQHTFGAERTCELVESSINVISKEDMKCQSLPINVLHNLCGCDGDLLPVQKSTPGEKTNEEYHNNTYDQCRFCPEGEILSDGSHSQDDTEHLILFNGQSVSCSDLKQVAANTTKESGICKEMQRLSTTACGCHPILPINRCQLCNPSEVLLGGDQEVIYKGEKITCLKLESLLREFRENSTECLAIADVNVDSGAESYMAQCKCSPVKNEDEDKNGFVSCTVCSGGEDVIFPDKTILDLESAGVNFSGHTCGTLDQMARSFNESNEICSNIRIVSKMCGCQVPENSCSVCSKNAVMKNPNAEIFWTYYGSLSDVLPQLTGGDLTESFDTNLKLSCEAADSLLAHAFNQDDFICNSGHLFRGTNCGCPPDSDVIAILWSQRCSGGLSLAGSLFIIFSILRTRKTGELSAFNQIILCISFFDGLVSLCFMMGAVMAPKESGLYGSIGNDETAYFVSWLFLFGSTSVVFYNVLLSLHFLAIIKYDWSDTKFQRFKKRAQGIICGSVIVLTCSSIPFTDPRFRWCHVSRPPLAMSWMSGLFFFVAPIGMSIVAMAVVTVIVCHHVAKVENKSRKNRLGGGNTTAGSLTSRTLWQSAWFLLSYVVVWPIQFVIFLVGLQPSNYWLFLVGAILGPLQGFLNALVWKRHVLSSTVNWLFEAIYDAIFSGFCFSVDDDRSSSVKLSPSISSQVIAEPKMYDKHLKGHYIDDDPSVVPNGSIRSHTFEGVSLHQDEINQLDITVADIQPYGMKQDEAMSVVSRETRSIWEHLRNSGLIADDEQQSFEQEQGSSCIEPSTENFCVKKVTTVQPLQQPKSRKHFLRRESHGLGKSVSNVLAKFNTKS